jgi:hypothetical protein
VYGQKPPTEKAEEEVVIETGAEVEAEPADIVPN